MYFLIARKFARKILADYHAGRGGPDSCDASQGILARNSREFILFAERMRGVGEVAKRSYGQFSENPRTIPLAAIFLPACTEFAWFRIVRESSAKSVANRWKIGQENSLGQTSVRNCARIYFLAEGASKFGLQQMRRTAHPGTHRLD